MKISELIKNLEKVKKDVGDLEVYGMDEIWDEDCKKISITYNEEDKGRVDISFVKLMDKDFSFEKF